MCGILHNVLTTFKAQITLEQVYFNLYLFSQVNSTYFMRLLSIILKLSVILTKESHAYKL